jgi:hypothetical protein
LTGCGRRRKVKLAMMNGPLLRLVRAVKAVLRAGADAGDPRTGKWTADAK